MLKWTFSYIALSGYRRNVWKFNVPIQNTQFNNCTIHPHCISSNLQWTTRYLFKNAIHSNRMGSNSTKNSRALTVPKLHRKHVGLAHPKDSGSDFFNYKSFFSIVLLALVGYDYKFIYLEVVCQGRISDGGVYRNSSLCTALSTATLTLPKPRPLLPLHENHLSSDSETKKTQFVFAPDDAFPLTANFMKPYAIRNLDDRKRIFNYRSSRIWRVTENAFGILVYRFLVFTSKTLYLEKAAAITLTAIVLIIYYDKNQENVTLQIGFCTPIWWKWECVNCSFNQQIRKQPP